MVSTQKLKWKSDFDKGVLIQNFERRGWQRTTEGKEISCLTLFHRRLEYLLGEPLDCEADLQS